MSEPEDREGYGEALILGCVGSLGARELIRDRLAAAGLVEGTGFLMVR